MKVSASTLKWLLRFYPPLLLQRIWVINISPDLKSLKVKVTKSLLNKNYNSSIFGGTIYAATDAFYPVLFHQLLSHDNYKIIVWLKSASIQYLKPGHTNLYFQISISDEELNDAKLILNTEGKFVQSYEINLYNIHNQLCATVISEVYIRNLNITGNEKLHE